MHSCLSYVRVVRMTKPAFLGEHNGTRNEIWAFASVTTFGGPAQKLEDEWTHTSNMFVQDSRFFITLNYANVCKHIESNIFSDSMQLVNVEFSDL